jgi:hypothetical protein
MHKRGGIRFQDQRKPGELRTFPGPIEPHEYDDGSSPQPQPDVLHASQSGRRSGNGQLEIQHPTHQPERFGAELPALVEWSSGYLLFFTGGPPP